jgi:hypothetical protein
MRPAYWGATVRGAAVSALVTIAAPLAMIVLWGTIAFAALVVLNAVLLTRLGQWDQ